MTRCARQSLGSTAIICELEAGHEGLHAWTDPAEGRTYRYGESGRADEYRRYHEARKRKGTLVTLSDAARERLRDIADRCGKPASRVVEDLVMAAPLPRRASGR